MWIFSDILAYLDGPAKLWHVLAAFIMIELSIEKVRSAVAALAGFLSYHHKKTFGSDE